MKFIKNKLVVIIIVLLVIFLGLIFYIVKNENKSIVESGVGSVLNLV